MIFVCIGSAVESNTSTEEDERNYLRMQGSEAGSTTWTEEEQGMIFIRKDQQQDQPHHHRRRTVGSASTVAGICHAG